MIEYDQDYYYNLLRIQASTAQMICDIRWDFIKAFLSPKGEELEELIVLDYGCGVGFMKAFAPKWAYVDTYDIMPVPQTGLRHDKYDLLMLYDVLEHIPDFTELLPTLMKVRHVVLSIPIKPHNIPWKAYKHFKPGEHLHYLTNGLLIYLFETFGFKLMAKEIPECPPREFVWTYMFKRIENEES